MPSPWTIFPSGGSDDRSMISILHFHQLADFHLVSTHRSHRPSGAPRNADDGINPLLQRNDRTLGGLNTGRVGRLALSEAAASISDYWVHGMESGPGPRGLLSTENPVSFVNNLLAAIGQGGSGFATMGGPHGALHFHVTGGPRGILPRELQTALGLRQPAQEPMRSTREEPMQPIIFLPAPTYQRWQEEARILFGTAWTEKAQRIVNSLLHTLVPPAVEREKKRQEDAAKEALEAKARLEAEQVANEKAAKEVLEKQEHEAAEALLNAAVQGEDADEADTRDEEAMEGIETSHTEESSPPSTQNAEDPALVEEANASASDQPERIRTTIRGSEVDITGMGIDLEYLDAEISSCRGWGGANGH
jgi:E3 ubiquitin-protein ligase HUWE1